MTSLRLPTFAFDEKEHPRGKPGNAGQFAPKGSSSSSSGSSQLEPDEYIEQNWPSPLHGVRDEKKVQRLMDDMRANGWVGRPILVIQSDNQALTGTHRIAAVRRLEQQGIDIKVPIINVDQDKLEAWAEETGGDIAILRTSDDDMRESFLKEMGDDRAARLMREEIDANENDFSALPLPVDESELIPMRAYGALPLSLPHDASEDLATVDLWKEVKAKSADPAVQDRFENLLLQRVQDGWAPPTEKQAKDGSYKKGRRKFQDLNVVVENPAGTVRMGKDPDGKPWKTKMFCDYGYISKAKGADGEGVDVYLGPNEKAADAFVVHQVDPKTGEPDEDKVMLGFDTVRDAKAAYLLHYDKPGYFGSVVPVPMAEFMEKVGFGKKAKYGKVEFASAVVGGTPDSKTLPREKMAQAVYLLALNNPAIPDGSSVKKSPEAYAERWMPSDTFTLRLVPLDQIDWQGSMGPGSVVPDDYGNVKGPIIIEENKYNVGGINGTSEQAPRVVVLEGQKRLSEARTRGQKAILAWVGSSLGPMGEVAPQGNVVRPGGNQGLLEPVGLPEGGP